ncbi:hypothetical protein KAX02_08185 [candidate division WOR-3 bacterium]|nr:hypothetical protein [candidate division WOR-3 bacterium]
MKIKDFNLRESFVNIAGMYAGSLVTKLLYKYMTKHAEFERNITFSGAVRYANRMV